MTPVNPSKKVALAPTEQAAAGSEADDYFSVHNLPHLDVLLFMDENYYNWELEESGSEGNADADGEEPEASDPEDENTEHWKDMGGMLGTFYVSPQQQQMQHVLLSLPLPCLSTICVPALQHLFQDVATCQGKVARGQQQDAKEVATIPTAMPATNVTHNAVVAAATAVSEGGGSVVVMWLLEGESLQLLPHLHEEGEPEMLPMHGLRDLAAVCRW
ncbi:hypothetical protein B0H10DRAFT_2221735 [Mycena sp. CBHHK59/15]|nr:hypothetical protein B0H10DRAFT_2221735 [Mycena sp. CBHHK59/15]